MTGTIGDIRSRRDESSEATRGALLAAARDLLGKYGYTATSIDMVASTARVTTGAIYHHFQNKKDLFKATAEALQVELFAEAATIRGPDCWTRLRVGYDLMLERFSDSAVHRILFVEAPQVLGPRTWHEIELRYCYGSLCDILRTLITRRIVRDFPTGLLARQLVGLLRESSAELIESGNDAHVRAQVAELIDRIFCAIRTDSASPSGSATRSESIM